MQPSEQVGSAVCNSCGYVYPEPAKIASRLSSVRKPCPECGAIGIAFGMSLSSTLIPRGMLVAKARYDNVKKPFVEIKTGSDLHKKSGLWNHLVRRIDREKDQYTEKITDPKTGKLIHETNERLSSHAGHGSAKRNKTDS